ncbi:hypothetical protein [Allocoleopsis sp.]
MALRLVAFSCAANFVVRSIDAALTWKGHPIAIADTQRRSHLGNRHLSAE